MLILNSRNCSSHIKSILCTVTQPQKLALHKHFKLCRSLPLVFIPLSRLQQCRSKKGAVHKNAEFTNTAHTTCQSDNTLSSRLPLPSPPSRLTAAQPLLMLDHTTSHKQAAELCSTGQLEPLKEEQKEWPSQAAVISQESAEVFCCTLVLISYGKSSERIHVRLMIVSAECVAVFVF